MEGDSGTATGMVPAGLGLKACSIFLRGRNFDDGTDTHLRWMTLDMRQC